MADRRRHSARTEDSERDTYSEDFNSDEEPPPKSIPTKQKASHHRGKARAHGRGHGRGQGGGRGGRRSQAHSDSHVDVVTKRLLSANRLKMNDLVNQLEEVRKEMRIVQDENKLYKRMQYKQEKKLVKYEDRESELPQLIQSHNNEVRSLREQLRRAREKFEKTDRYLRDAEDELETTKGRLRKYKSLSEQKELAERSELDRRLNKAEQEASEKESRIKDLERHLEMLKKNHKHEMGIERARSKETHKELEQLKETNHRLEVQVKEKDKELEMKNIYSNRFIKPGSYNGTPAESPPPWRTNLKKKSESLTDLTPREKAKAYEDKRKAEGKLKLPKVHTAARRTQMVTQFGFFPHFGYRQAPKTTPSFCTADKPPTSREPKPKVEERGKDQNHDLKFNSLQRQDSESDFWKRQEERYRRDLDNRGKQDEDRQREEERQAAMFRQEREKMQRDMEERERAEKQRREADERERHTREREETERKERDEKNRKEREERERERREAAEREKREQERRAREERLDNDEKLSEERRKKDELLRRLQQMDANRDGSQPSVDPFAPSDSTRAKGMADAGDAKFDPLGPSPSRRRSKDPFGFSRDDSSDSAPNSRKDYSFTRSVENMHQGKPARDDVSVPYIDRQKRLQAAKDDDIGGYQPSFSPAKAAGKKKNSTVFGEDPKPQPRHATEEEKKAKLLADLFGSSTAVSGKTGDGKKDESEEFFLGRRSPKHTQAKKTAGFPWDNPTSPTKTNGSVQRESSTLFGGGAALVEDDFGSGGSKSGMLSKRPRQPANTLSSRPAYVAVDDVDDDIEEVVL